MKEELFISIMRKHGVADNAVIHNAYQDILHEITQEHQVVKECKSDLEKMVGKLSRDILNFRVAVNSPFFLYRDYLERRCRQNRDIYLWQFTDNLKMYVAFLESRLNGRVRVKIVDNDIKITPTSLIKEIKRMAGIAADAINNCICSDVRYDAITGRFTITVNITDGTFYTRQGISYHFGESDARKAIFSGVLKGQKVKFDLKIGKEEVFTDFEIGMVQKSEETSVSLILYDSVNKANKVINGKQYL